MSEVESAVSGVFFFFRVLSWNAFVCVFFLGCKRCPYGWESVGNGLWGGLGGERVKLAYHEDTKEEFAVKVMKKRDIRDRLFTENVRKEVSVSLWLAVKKKF